MTRKIAVALAIVTLALMMGMGANLANAAGWSANLLMNPGAETGDLTGWTVIDQTESGFVGAQIAWNSPLMRTHTAGPPHSGTYVFASDWSIQTTAQDIWYIEQIVGVPGGEYIKGDVWGVTNAKESVRLIVSEYDGSTLLSTLYDSGWRNSNRHWTQFSFAPTLLNAATDTVKFTMGAYKYSGAGSYQDAGLDDANLQVTPEPATMLLLGSGLLGFALLGKARRKRS